MTMMKGRRSRAGRGLSHSARRTRRGGATIVALCAVVLALALAACGGSSGSSSSTGASAGTNASAQSANSNKLEKFAQCMRSNGVPSFPDPVNGRLQLKVTKGGGGGLNPGSPQFKSAEQKCKSLAPSTLGNGSPSPQAQQAQLKFAQCMQSHGVPKFPEPSANGAMRITSGNGVDPQSPQFKSAMQACRKLLPGGGQSVGG